MTFRKEAGCAEWKFPDWSRKTFSRSFDSGDSESWKNALRAVHDHCWKKWKLACKEPGFQLKKSEQAQVPGQVSESVFKDLQEWIDNLPEKKKRQKKVANT